MIPVMAVYFPWDPWTISRGNPSEIVHGLVPKSLRRKSFEDKVVYLLDLALSKNVRVILPDEGTVGDLSSLLVGALIHTNILRELPKA